MAEPPRPPPRPAHNKSAPTVSPSNAPVSAPIVAPLSAPVTSSRVISTGGYSAATPAETTSPTVQTPSIPGVMPAISSIPAAASPSMSGSIPAVSSSQPSFNDESSGAWSNPAASVNKDPNIGKLFGGKYLIERLLGEGGMGKVYLAKHKAIGKRFAIKLLHTDAIKDPEVVERFKVEAQAASSIGNEHIIDITDFAELDDGSTFFVMEYLDGKSLTKLIEELKRIPTTRLVRIAKQLTQGLGAAHTAGIVHRDLKPDNIFLCKRSGGETDFIKILDFGIAKVGASTNKLTKAGAIFGTPHYMSPEQASGSPIDHRTDIYAIGVILYEAAVGRVPFDADNFMGILTQHMYKAPVPPRAIPECPPDLPPGLEVIIMRCLRKKPEERYSTMEELEADLDRLARGEVPKAAHDMMALSAGYQSLAQSAISAHQMPNPIPGEPPAGGPTKTKWPLYAGVAGVLAVISIAVVALVGPSKTSANSPPTPTQDPNAAKVDSKPTTTTTVTSATTPLVGTTSTAPTKKTRSVMIDPPAPNARIYDDSGKPIGDDVGAQSIELEEGASKTVTVKAAGFKDATVKLDYKTSPKKIVPKMPPLAGTATTKPNKPQGGGDIDNPWGK